MELEQISMVLVEPPYCRTIQDYVNRISSKLVFEYNCSHCGPEIVYVKSLVGKILVFDWPHHSTTEHLMNMIWDKEGIAPDKQKLIWYNKILRAGTVRADYGIAAHATMNLLLTLRGGGPEHLHMSIAAGGQIQQKIYEDARPTSLYDEETAERVWIHIVSTSTWEEITGIVAPITRIVAKTYANMNYAWHELFDDHLPTIPPSSGFKHVRSVDQRDGVFKAKKRFMRLIMTSFASIFKTSSSKSKGDTSNTANVPPQCSAHPTLEAALVFRPCSHLACDTCFGKSLLSNSRCTLCGATVAKYVGFKKPVPRTSTEGDVAEGWVVEEEEHRETSLWIKSGTTVVTRVLKRDHVAPLRGWIED